MSTKERALIDTVFRCMRMLASAVSHAYPGVKIRVAIEWPCVPVKVGEGASMTPIPEFQEREAAY